MNSTVSPLAPKIVKRLPTIGGIRLATAAAGIKGGGRDVLLVLLDKGTTVAGVFTRSRCPSAPVDWCRKQIKRGSARALLVNSGNANAFTGMKGRQAVETSARETAKAAGCADQDVYLASTGVIGEPLDPNRFTGLLADLADTASTGDWLPAAQAIMTTDTFPKLATETAELGGVKVRINGIAKGSGMIAPDMGTMLSFIFTDAPIAAPVLQSMLDQDVQDSFNAITVDSDTSTSDTVLLFATGAAEERGAPRIETTDDPILGAFRLALKSVLRSLAHQIVRDGEGATKFVEINVEGSVSKRSARRVALSIANSPLVKTAIAGEDANWGRVVMAVGKAGEPADRDKLAIWFGPHRVAVDGDRDPDYSEDKVSKYMKGSDIRISVNLGLGQGSDTVWTCDLTSQYVAINGNYRT